MNWAIDAAYENSRDAFPLARTLADLYVAANRLLPDMDVEGMTSRMLFAAIRRNHARPVGDDSSDSEKEGSEHGSEHGSYGGGAYDWAHVGEDPRGDDDEFGAPGDGDAPGGGAPGAPGADEVPGPIVPYSDRYRQLLRTRNGCAPTRLFWEHMSCHTDALMMVMFYRNDEFINDHILFRQYHAGDPGDPGNCRSLEDTQALQGTIRDIAHRLRFGEDEGNLVCTDMRRALKHCNPDTPAALVTEDVQEELMQMFLSLNVATPIDIKRYIVVGDDGLPLQDIISDNGTIMQLINAQHGRGVLERTRRVQHDTTTREGLTAGPMMRVTVNNLSDEIVSTDQLFDRGTYASDDGFMDDFRLENGDEIQAHSVHVYTPNQPYLILFLSRDLNMFGHMAGEAGARRREQMAAKAKKKRKKGGEEIPNARDNHSLVPAETFTRADNVVLHLFGIIIHVDGGVGHYYAYFKCEDAWYIYDDYPRETPAAKKARRSKSKGKGKAKATGRLAPRMERIGSFEDMLEYDESVRTHTRLLFYSFEAGVAPMAAAAGAAEIPEDEPDCAGGAAAITQDGFGTETFHYVRTKIRGANGRWTPGECMDLTDLTDGFTVDADGNTVSTQRTPVDKYTFFKERGPTNRLVDGMTRDAAIAYLSIKCKDPLSAITVDAFDQMGEDQYVRSDKQVNGTWRVDDCYTSDDLHGIFTIERRMDSPNRGQLVNATTLETLDNFKFYPAFGPRHEDNVITLDEAKELLGGPPDVPVARDTLSALRDFMDTSSPYFEDRTITGFPIVYEWPNTRMLFDPPLPLLAQEGLAGAIVEAQQNLVDGLQAMPDEERHNVIVTVAATMRAGNYERPGDAMAVLLGAFGYAMSSTSIDWSYGTDLDGGDIKLTLVRELNAAEFGDRLPDDIEDDPDFFGSIRKYVDPHYHPNRTSLTQERIMTAYVKTMALYYIINHMEATSDQILEFSRNQAAMDAIEASVGFTVAEKLKASERVDTNASVVNLNYLQIVSDQLGTLETFGHGEQDWFFDKGVATDLAHQF